MAQTSLLPSPNQQFLDINGTPLSGGKLYFYQPGTSTPKTVYSDSTGNTALTNPVILDSAGRASVWLSGFYKVILTDSNGVLIWSVDNVSSMAATTITQSEWLPQNLIFTYINATQFSTPGDVTTTFQVNRRIQATVAAGTVYGVINASSYAVGITTVTVALDTGSLDTGLSSVSIGLLSAINQSIPIRLKGGSNNTTGHLIPNVADDTFALLAASQIFTNKTLAGSKLAVAAKTVAYTLTATDSVVTGDATGAAFTFTLPAATGSGQTYTLKKIDSTANIITVARTGADTIEGLTSYPLVAQNNYLTLVDGTSGKWFILATNVKPSVLISLSADQAVTAATSTKIQFATKEYDDNGDFDAVTNYRWTPKLPGKYVISVTVVLLGGGAAQNGDLALFKNGVQSRAVSFNNTSASQQAESILNYEVLVASGDYFEVFIESGVALTVKKLGINFYTTAIATTFSAMKID